MQIASLPSHVTSRLIVFARTSSDCAPLGNHEATR
jgi:hypothetical protein